eukprot:TRINITY_DN52067_c0_g1_i1.p1 TRINITY_DN52067_c0_g1~~TRINITY_DN52067_c0_g1_i1.p1  ORF type:complete len:535 (-),score=37.41 TRINITY_DN52067_c0_g1_i1:12-1508(-)
MSIVSIPRNSFRNNKYMMNIRTFSTNGESVEVVPPLGDSVSSCIIKEWTKQPGDAVEMDEIVCVVETDKVTVDIRAPRAGVFVAPLGEEGQELEIGAQLYKLGEGTGNVSKSDEKPVEATSNSDNTETPPKVGAVTVEVVPSLGDSVTSAVIKDWTKQPGDNVEMDEVLCMAETDKVTSEIRAPRSGVFMEALCQDGDEIEIGAPLYKLGEGTGNIRKPAETPKATETPTQTPAPNKAPAQVTTNKPAATTPTPQNTPNNNDGDRSETRVKMTRMRSRIAQRLKESQNTAAMLTTFQEVDMSSIIDMRNQYKEQFEKVHKVKLGFMSAFVKASTAALQEVQAVNAVIDDATNEIIYRNYVDISVAVASPTGLVVPVLRNCEKMSFADVEKTISMFGQKAKDGSLAIEDMVGGTFTISNGGIFGSLFGTPIINPPQSAILGMHATKMRPVVVNGQVVAKPMMYLALTYDHRLIDGREAVTFLKSIQNKIEDPNRLLLEL